jgi:hypothetical protein
MNRESGPTIEPQCRRNHYDVSDRVRVSHPQDVEAAIAAIRPTLDRGVLAAAFRLFGRLYAGTLPGFAGCDAWYHDAQHSLDVALAAARLIEGHERDAAPTDRLGDRRRLLGIILALFHDVGYVRQAGEDATTGASNGAVFTLSHVERSGAFLEQQLPQLGFSGEEAALAHRLVHFTGYEQPLDSIAVRDPRDRTLGFLVASADLIAQTADRCYLEKCRDFLFPEFVICGLAGPPRPAGPRPIYATIEDLLGGTPEFNRRLWAERLDGYFDGVHRYFGSFFGSGFGGANPYVDGVRANLARISAAIAGGSDFAALRLRPRAIRAAELRAILDSGE